MNVALYGARGSRWCMTERGARSLDRGRDWLSIGPSSLRWDGTALTVCLDEIAVPLPRRVRGTVRLFPSAIESRVLALDKAGRHRWRPIAPCARVEVAMDNPGISWSGHAYFDTNAGGRPLENDFRRWDWSRASAPGGTTVVYDIERNAPEDRLTVTMRYDRAGGVEDLTPGTTTSLPRTRWRLDRRIGAQAGHAPSVAATLEDTPFYARSIVATQMDGRPAMAVHESLSLIRFRNPVVQAMLPFRMPRAFTGR